MKEIHNITREIGNYIRSTYSIVSSPLIAGLMSGFGASKAMGGFQDGEYLGGSVYAAVSLAFFALGSFNQELSKMNLEKLTSQNPRDLL